jgi:AAA ATPase domain
VPPIQAKGKAEPIPAWEALQARPRFGGGLFQHAHLLVGRERELDVLKDALTRAREEGVPQLITLVGVPGIGKSRLVYALMQATATDPSGLTWRQGRPLPYGDGVSFWALAEVVKAQAGILETDAKRQAQTKLARAVQTLIDDAADAEWVERLLRPLVGLGGETEAPHDRSEAFAAWRRFFEALADTRPAVLVFEDLQWADDGLLDFVDSLLEWITGTPLLVVATARQELLERRPGWGGGKANATTLSLSPLSDEQIRRLIGELVGHSQLAAETQEALVSHAAGNALYAEQYTRMHQERGQTQQIPLPETVHGIIAARLDNLSPAEKSVVQTAAVFGEIFWEGAVGAVDAIERDSVAESLHTLERREFVQRVHRSSVAGETEYSFRHVLVRDVAYGQIPREARADKHGRAAAWIQSLGRGEDHADTLAYHYLSAFKLMRAAGRSSDILAARARDALIQAGDRALGLSASSSAASYYAQALELLAEEDPGRAQLLFAYARALFASGDDARADALENAKRALLAVDDRERAAETEALLAEVWWLRGRRDECDEHLERARELVGDAAPSAAKARVLAQAARFRVVANDQFAAVALGRDALEMAELLMLDEIRAHALITVGLARYQADDEGGSEDIRRGLELALATNHLAAASRAYTTLVTTTADQLEALELSTAAEELCLRIGDREGARYPRAVRASALFALGRADEVVPLLDDFIADCEAGRPHYAEAGMRILRAWVRLSRDDVDGASDDTEKALAAARAAKDPQQLFMTLGEATWLCVELGRPDEANRLGRELIAADPSAPRWSAGFAIVADQIGFQAAVQDALADAPSTQPRIAVHFALAERRYTDAIDLLTSSGFISWAARVRTLAAATLHEQGRRAEAADQLEQALAFWRSVDATRYIRETEALLEKSRVPAQRPEQLWPG